MNERVFFISMFHQSRGYFEWRQKHTTYRLHGIWVTSSEVSNCVLYSFSWGFF